MSIINMSPNNAESKEKRPFYHLFFIFTLKNYDKKIAYHFLSHTSEDALYNDCNLIQSNFETLQEACQNKINFYIYHCISDYSETNKVKTERPSELADITIIDVIEDVTELITKELENNTYPELPHPAIARKENHLVLGMYANKDIKYNIVANEDLIRNYIYNTIYRFGRLIYTDGIRTYNGCIKDEYLKPYDEKAKTFYKGYGKNICMATPTIPYE